MPRFLVIVPTYNEVDNVAPLVEGIRAHAPGVHVLFVDDNSRDGTREVIRRLTAAHPGEVELLSRERKLGLGTAYVAGFKWGLARDYDGMIEMDADLSHRPVDLGKLVDELRSRPVVVGSRYIEGGGTENWGALRRAISRVGSFYARTILNVRTRDLTGGFNGWRREVIEAIRPEALGSEGYTFQIELKYRALRAGFPIHEMPILFVERRAGQSKMSGRIVLEAMYRVWLLRLIRIETRPARGSAGRLDDDAAL